MAGKCVEAAWFLTLVFLADGKMYRMRDPVRVGHSVKVQLEEGREVDVVTVSDDSTGLAAFKVEGFLTAEECEAIKSAAPASAFQQSAVGRDFEILEDLKSGKGRARIFRLADSNRDGAMDAAEFARFLQRETDVVDSNFSQFVETQLGMPDSARAAQKMVSEKEFASVNWRKYLADLAEQHPERFSRHSSQTWLSYGKHKVLKALLRKVAAVTGLSHKLVKEIAEELQLLRYSAHGGHYSCHHDSAPDQPIPRFLTAFVFLNDVSDGGETVLFGTEMNGTNPARWGRGHVAVWEDLENQCQSVKSSCPASPEALPPEPFSRALVVKPQMGTLLFWYNAKVNSRGQTERFLWSSIHGGCPTRTQEKWAANVWLKGAGYAARRQEL
eukprot:TRINITY_DN35566_c0_g1_i2.p1 TRINITY_DN35566_c0_g1~~TRINITY_DN35566_c0_g1_i2.p1  ORF type:complete len:385 (+),score=71.53 TRINITY_DN35566_c0_g1_i2:65-1219(+)